MPQVIDPTGDQATYLQHDPNGARDLARVSGTCRMTNAHYRFIHPDPCNWKSLPEQAVIVGHCPPGICGG